MTLLVDETLKLPNPLGVWTAHPHHSWIWHYHSATDTIYRKTEMAWIRYHRSQAATRTNPIFRKDFVTPTAPPNLSYTTVLIIDENFVSFEGTDHTMVETLPTTLLQPCDSYWVLQHSNIRQHFNDPRILLALQNGTISAVCDGSYKPKLQPKGTSASWIMEDSTSSLQISGTIATSGIKADAYRGELLGIYTILSAISYIERYNKDFPSGNVTISCDNLQAGRVSSKDTAYAAPTSKHFDIVKAIRRLLQSLTTKVTFQHVYGHQDKNTPFLLLPREAQLNVLVDDSAQAAFDYAYANNTFIPNPKFYHEGWIVSIGGVKLQDNIPFHIRQWIGKKKLRQYLYGKDLIAWTVFPLIDFDTLHKHISSQPQAYQLWYTKHWTNFCGIGAKMQQMKLWDNNLCPCCRQVPEQSTTHLFLCPHPSMVKLRNTSFHNILEWLKDANTDPLLQYILSSFWHGEEVHFDADHPPELKYIYNTMRDIGLHQMWGGFIPTAMVAFQHEYYQTIGNNQTGQKWAITFIGKMIRATHSLWIERNHLLHLQTENGIRGLNLISMRTAIEQQLQLGYENLNANDHYLLDVELETLMKEPVDIIRGWLCDILIARGDLASARLESLRDRGNDSHCLPHLTEAEITRYLDWRNVQLTTQNY